MSTVLGPRTAQTTERIRHPLQAVRKYIRTYVLLEGAALALLFLAAWFWLGVLVDWGSFAAFSFDWVQELQNLDESKTAAFYIRVVLLVVLVGCLVALAITKMALRLTKEFSDPAVALVLERRFPQRARGPAHHRGRAGRPGAGGPTRLFRGHGGKDHSGGRRAGRAPARRRRVQLGADCGSYWLWCGLATIGLLRARRRRRHGSERGDGRQRLARHNSCGASATSPPSGPSATCSLWIPTGRATPTSRSSASRTAPSHPGEMRVGRDEQRPDLLVRAVQLGDRRPRRPRRLAALALERPGGPVAARAADARRQVPSDFEPLGRRPGRPGRRRPRRRRPRRVAWQDERRRPRRNRAVRGPIASVHGGSGPGSAARLARLDRGQDRLAESEGGRPPALARAATRTHTRPWRKCSTRLEELAVSPSMSRTAAQAGNPDPGRGPISRRKHQGLRAGRDEVGPQVLDRPERPQGIGALPRPRPKITGPGRSRSRWCRRRA